MSRPLFVCLALCALALSGCGAVSSTSTSAFKGPEREVASAIADLQSDASSAEQKKICTNDLAATVVGQLGGTKGCEAAIKRQLKQVNELELSIQSVKIASDGKTASATVKSVHEGKTRPSPLALVKEGGKWKISGL